ncbi:MAG: alpha-L-fucosidase, partial [Staphylococcus epidermidis]|nr:alpha-L-fucosidase [Staphylococcus epidermidis]
PKAQYEELVKTCQVAPHYAENMVKVAKDAGMKYIVLTTRHHDGFSFVNVFSPCVTYNKVNTYDWFKEHLTSIDDIEGYDITDKQLAMKTVLDHESLVKGIVYQDTTTPSYESQISELEHEALAKRDIHITEETFNDLTAQFL